MRKLAFCICENKDTDQLRDNHEAAQRLCFRYTDSTVPLLPKSEISSISSSSVTVQLDLCQTWLEILKTGFLRTRLIFSKVGGAWSRPSLIYNEVNKLLLYLQYITVV